MSNSNIRRAIETNLSSLNMSESQKQQLQQSIIYKTETHQKARRRSLPMIVSCAVILILLLAPAVGVPLRGFDSFHNDGHFIMVVGDADYAPDYSEEITVPESVRRTWGSELAQYLIDSRAYVSLPDWIPVGFSPSYLRMEDNKDGNFECFALYSDPAGRELELHVSVRSASVNLPQYYYLHRDGGLSETWKIGGMEYHYEETYFYNYIAWMENNCVAVISGNLDKSEFQRMAESIGN